LFEEAIKSLNQELEGLRAKHNKCYELMEKVQDKTKKEQLTSQHDKLGQAIDRAAVCIAILSFQVPMEITNESTIVKFPLPKPISYLPSRINCYDRDNQALLHDGPNLS
jgi:hypothetical protein